MAKTINHFSHREHALVLTPSTELNPHGVHCSLCSSNRPTNKEVYACRPCLYFLHPHCTRLEYQTYIVAHDDHLSTLITSPPQESTLCKACGGKIFGSRYSCNSRTCRYDVHVTCAQAGKTIRVEDHEHPLCLDFPRPQDNGARQFKCSRWGQGDQGFWGYTCKACHGYYLHLDCNVFRPSPSSGPVNPVGNGTSNADITLLQNKVQSLERQLQGNQVMNTISTAVTVANVARLGYNIEQEVAENTDKYKSILDEIEKQIGEDVDLVFGSIGGAAGNFGEDLVDTIGEFSHDGVDLVEHIASTGAELAGEIADKGSSLLDFVISFF